MAIRTYKVTLDSKNTIAPEPVFLRQGDKTGAVVIDATLMDNGSPVSIDGLTPMFKANTADGQAVIADSTGFNIVNASGGEFTYQVPNALSAVPGKITTAYFSFSDSSGSESTFDVAFIIKKAVDITKPQADDYITIIDGTLQSLQKKIDAMNTDVQTILNAFNQGDFYNRTQTDEKDTATLASAKSYADAGDSTALTNFTTLDAKFNNLSGGSSWQTSGITLGAGVRWYSDEEVSVGRFKVIDFGGGWQLVMIHGAVTNVTKSGQVIINLPQSIAPDMQYHYTSPATGQKHSRFLLDTNGNLVSENMSTGTYVAGDWIPFDTLYLRKG